MRHLDTALANLKFDSRMIDWNIKNGLLTKEELQTYLNSLKDCSGNTVNIDLEEDSDYSNDNGMN
ncbi:MAG: hypothetical protein KDD40_01320 [Bdellovibrionales bacterium]|nr:hypothetical protein [Bdellovibrionales bacterium]